MGHTIESCDVVDELEASVRLRRALRVTLKSDRHFVDQASDVVTESGEDWAIFRQHGRVRVRDISFCAPAEPPEPAYRGKL
jgi:Rho-binding antiterminator